MHLKCNLFYRNMLNEVSSLYTWVLQWGHAQHGLYITRMLKSPEQHPSPATPAFTRLLILWILLQPSPWHRVPNCSFSPWFPQGGPSAGLLCTNGQLWLMGGHSSPGSRRQWFACPGKNRRAHAALGVCLKRDAAWQCLLAPLQSDLAKGKD